MKTRILFFLIVVIYLSLHVCGQTDLKKSEKKVSVSMEGVLSVSFGKNFYSINLGGPSLVVHINKDLRFAAGPVPSLYSTGGKFGPRLGMAPRIEYKSVVFIMPFFTGEKFGDWVGSIGLGYKFRKRQ
jgi:hypothetical protein